MLEAPQIAEITVQDSLLDRLHTMILLVLPGHFIQIERTGRNGPKSVVALRFTGDRATFAREVERMFVDAVEATQGNQTVKICVTGD